MRSKKVTKNTTFHRWIIIKEIDPKIYRDGQKKRRVLAICKCGKEVETNLAELQSGRSKSCGCYSSEKRAKLNKERKKPKIHKISQNKLKELLKYDPDTGNFIWLANCPFNLKPQTRAGYRNSQEYVMITIRGTAYSAHRLAWLYMTGRWPKNQIDHINHIRFDNRFENLREVTLQENHQNLSINIRNKTGVLGVSWDKNRLRWRARIGIGGKDISLGFTKNFNEAADLRRKGELKYNFHSNHGK